jgi:hypothetical protein
MTAARVALVGLPDMAREIVAGALGADPELALVGNEDDAERAVERLGANVLVVSEDALTADETTELLRRRPDVRLIGISEDGRQAYARSGSKRVLLGGLSPEALRAAVRGGEAT